MADEPNAGRKEETRRVERAGSERWKGRRRRRRRRRRALVGRRRRLCLCQSPMVFFPLSSLSLFSPLFFFHSQLVREDAGRHRGTVIATPADEHDAVVLIEFFLLSFTTVSVVVVFQRSSRALRATGMFCSASKLFLQRASLHKQPLHVLIDETSSLSGSASAWGRKRELPAVAASRFEKEKKQRKKKNSGGGGGRRRRQIFSHLFHRCRFRGRTPPFLLLTAHQASEERGLTVARAERNSPELGHLGLGAEGVALLRGADDRLASSARHLDARGLVLVRGLDGVIGARHVRRVDLEV